MEEIELFKVVDLIDNIYKELYKSKEVLHGKKNRYNKYKNILLYIKRLERIHSKIKNNPYHKEKIKQLFYDKYIIKSEFLRDEYIEKYEQIIQNQCISLNRWLDFYFNSESDDIPMWAKFWSFQGMLKLGTFNKQTNTFNRRGKNNICVFADLNIEALRLSIELLSKYLNGEEFESEYLTNIVKTYSFKRIYEFSLKILSQNKKNNIYDGIWIKYDQGSNPELLISSLHGYNTDWCISGFATAYKQLLEGDFYIYYTKDKNNEYKVPRLCIRMLNNNIIREICGIAYKQNIESGFEDIIVDKINNFKDKEQYSHGLKQLQRLTYIYNKFINNEELTKDDLIFIYEINENIIGVVPNKDYRINEIIKQRNIRHDLALIFNCREDKIALNQYEVIDNPEGIICLYDNLKIEDNNVNFPKLQFVKGNIQANYLKDANGFKSLKRVGGNIEFESMIDATGFHSLIDLGGSAIFPILKTSVGFENLKNIGNNAYFPELLDTLGFISLNSIGTNSFFPNYSEIYFPKVIDIKGLENIEKFNGIVILDSLQNLDKFIHLKEVRGNIYLKAIDSIEKLTFNFKISDGKLYLNKELQKKYENLLSQNNLLIKRK